MGNCEDNRVIHRFEAQENVLEFIAMFEAG